MIYEDREEAGKVLVREIGDDVSDAARIVAIPNGGVLVGAAMAKELGIPLDIIVIRKVQIPWNTEAGFGSVASDGSVILNKPLLEQLRLAPEEVEAQIEKTRRNVRERLKTYGASADFSRVRDTHVILTDDGLASGVTMEAAVRMIKKYGPASTTVAVPTASASAVRRLRDLVDEIVCPDVRGGWSFAVASAYRNWYDVSDAEVLNTLNKWGHSS